jgi:PAS domain S-box-containing protein
MLKRFFKNTSKKAYEIISNHIDQVILLSDEEGYISYASNSVLNLLGYTSKELKNIHLSEIVNQENAIPLKTLIETCKRKTYSRYKYWLKLKNNNYKLFFIESNFIPEETKIIHTLNIPEKYQEQGTELHIDDRRYKFLLNNMSDCIIVVNKEGNITHASGLKNTLGYEDEEVIGGTAILPVHPDDKQKTIEVLNEFYETDKLSFSRIDYRLLNTTGDYVWFEANFKIIQDIYTGENQILNNLRDITERKRMERELKESNKTKDKLFSIIAHDLKNPISNLTGFANLLKNDYYNESEEELKNSINRIYESSKLINELMENLLNWSRAQYRRISPFPEALSLKETFNHCLSYFEDTLTNKEITLLEDFDEGKQVYADKQMLQAIFRNLLSNAIKFSPPQSSITVGNQSENSSSITIYIEDQGEGLSEEEQNQVLDDHQFISTHGTYNEKGLGLGLKIIKEFVKKNNGEIWFEKNRKTGTKLFIKLPKA